MLTRVNFRIFANSAYIWFSRFSWNGHSKNDYFHEKNLKNISGEFVKIEEFTLVIIFVIFHQKWKLRLKMEVLKFLGIHPKLNPRIFIWLVPLPMDRKSRSDTLAPFFCPWNIVKSHAKWFKIWLTD